MGSATLENFSSVCFVTQVGIRCFVTTRENADQVGDLRSHRFYSILKEEIHFDAKLFVNIF